MGLVSLSAAAAADPAMTGSKAARLAAALAAGFPVPDGFVVPVGQEVDDAALAAAAAAVAGRLAVRSSAVAEDLAEASYAGLYESYLDLAPAQVPDAVRRCRRSVDTARVAAYQARPGPPTPSPVSLCWCRPWSRRRQPGVAFTADPLTGIWTWR